MESLIQLDKNDPNLGWDLPFLVYGQFVGPGYNDGTTQYYREESLQYGCDGCLIPNYFQYVDPRTGANWYVQFSVVDALGNPNIDSNGNYIISQVGVPIVGQLVQPSGNYGGQMTVQPLQDSQWWNIPLPDMSDPIGRAEYNAQVLLNMIMSDMIGSTGMFKTGWWQAYVPSDISQEAIKRTLAYVQGAMQNVYNAYENETIYTFSCSTDQLAQFFSMPRRTFLAVQRLMLNELEVQDLPYLVPVYTRITTVNGEFQNGMQHMAEHPCGSTYHGDFNLGDPSSWLAVALAIGTGGMSFGLGSLAGMGGIVGLGVGVGSVLAETGNLSIQLGGKDITSLVLDVATGGMYSLDAATVKMVQDIQNNTFTIADINHVIGKMSFTLNAMTDLGDITIGVTATEVIKALVVAAVMLSASGVFTALADGSISMKQAVEISQFGVTAYAKTNALLNPPSTGGPVLVAPTDTSNPVPVTTNGTVDVNTPLTSDQAAALANQMPAIPTQQDSGVGVGGLLALVGVAYTMLK